MDRDQSPPAARGASKKSKAASQKQAKSPSRYSNHSNPSPDPLMHKAKSSSESEDEIGYDSESDYDSQNEDGFDQYKNKKKDKRRTDIDFQRDYHPLRLGLKPEQKLVVIEYQTPSNSRVFQHYIKVEKYFDSNNLALSISKS